jgi:hypothetical protein
VCANSDPIDLPSKASIPWFRANAPDADYSVELPRANAPHTVANSKLPEVIGITLMRSLVDQHAHHFTLQRGSHNF